jgi:MtN3 and saliva related transmembrane protein
MTDILDKVFGYVGSSLLIISMIPQLYKTYKIKSAGDISSVFLGIQLVTSVTLLTYSILIYQIPMIYGNCGILIELLILSCMKWKWRNRVRTAVTTTNIIEMRNRFPDEPDNLNKILERKTSFIRKRILLHERFDLESGKDNFTTFPDIETYSSKSEEEDLGSSMNSSYSSTEDNVFYETTL